MSELIDRLFGQALDEVVPETWTTLDMEQISKVKMRFAELIIQECNYKANKYIDDCVEVSSIPEWVLTSHFDLEQIVNNNKKNKRH